MNGGKREGAGRRKGSTNFVDMVANVVAVNQTERQKLEEMFDAYFDDQRDGLLDAVSSLKEMAPADRAIARRKAAEWARSIHLQ